MRNKRKNKLNIYGTLGPSCASKSILIDMFRSGMTGIRLNLSHCALTDREDWLDHFYQACDELHILPDFLVDLQGPELRVGKMNKEIILKENDVADLTPVSAMGKEGTGEIEAADMGTHTGTTPLIPCPDILFSYLREGQVIKVDDGKIHLAVEALMDGDCNSGPDKADKGPDSDLQSHLKHNRVRARTRVLTGGNLLSGKSIAIEGISVPLPPLTRQDRDMIGLLGRYRVTGVMQPFVRKKEDLIALREELAQAGMNHVKIYAKIESQEGADHLMDFLPYCDEVVIARGDLGNAIPLTSLPVVQKQLSSICLMARKPFMVVTQMLASMEKNPVPTRAEVSDIANAVLDGASSIMLTGETAAGNYPVQAMNVFCRTAFEAQRYLLTGKRMF